MAGVWIAGLTQATGLTKSGVDLPRAGEGTRGVRDVRLLQQRARGRRMGRTFAASGAGRRTAASVPGFPNMFLILGFNGVVPYTRLVTGAARQVHRGV